jgi:hypothetical protein
MNNTFFFKLGNVSLFHIVLCWVAYLEKAAEMRSRILRFYSPQRMDEPLKTRDELLQNRPSTAKETLQCSPLTCFIIGPSFASWIDLLIVYRRGCNLCDKLVHANCQLQKRMSQALLRPLPNSSYKCRGCTRCNNMKKCESFCHPHTGKRFQINDIISCSTTHVIYMTKCPCGLWYVGKTCHSHKQDVTSWP